MNANDARDDDGDFVIDLLNANRRRLVNLNLCNPAQEIVLFIRHRSTPPRSQGDNVSDILVQEELGQQHVQLCVSSKASSYPKAAGFSSLPDTNILL
ncbi:hypothetical protein [Bradyrhizobium sp. USDA 3315]